MFKNMTIGKKIGLGFGMVLVALSVVVALSFTGVGGIVDNAEQVIYGNSLDADMTQKEVDHLNWANEVSALLTDEQVTKLDVEIDDHQTLPDLKLQFLQPDVAHRVLVHVRRADQLAAEIVGPGMVGAPEHRPVAATIRNDCRAMRANV